MKVCCATSRPVYDSHCTDRPVLVRVAGSSTISTCIDQSIDPKQLAALPVRSACGRAAIGEVLWPARSHVGAKTALLVLCMCCMALPCCMCVVCMLSVDTVGSTAEKERSERSTHAVLWTYRCIMLDGSRTRRLREIVRDIRR